MGPAGVQNFSSFRPASHVHQVNLEYLAKGVLSRNPNPKSEIRNLLSRYAGRTDSHTTMINGSAWSVGRGGIEAEAGMLGQPVYF